MNSSMKRLQDLLDEMEMNLGLIPPYEITDNEFKSVELFVEDFIKYHTGTIMEGDLYKLYNSNVLIESNNKTYIELLNDLL